MSPRPHCRLRTYRNLWILGGAVLCWTTLSVSAKEEIAPVIERLEAGSFVEGSSGSYWTVVSATSIVAPSTPEIGLLDFAHHGNLLIDRVTVSANPIEDVSPEAPLWDGAAFTHGEDHQPAPTFWTAPAPATFTLTFKRPIELRYVDLRPASRKHGFADFTALARGEAGGELHEVVVKEATVSAGTTTDAAFQWRLEVVPERVIEVAIRFHLGSLHLPRQIFLQDLDLWGKASDENEVGAK